MWLKSNINADPVAPSATSMYACVADEVSAALFAACCSFIACGSRVLLLARVAVGSRSETFWCVLRPCAFGLRAEI